MKSSILFSSFAEPGVGLQHKFPGIRAPHNNFHGNHHGNHHANHHGVNTPNPPPGGKKGLLKASTESHATQSVQGSPVKLVPEVKKGNGKGKGNEKVPGIPAGGTLAGNQPGGKTVTEQAEKGKLPVQSVKQQGSNPQSDAIKHDAKKDLKNDAVKNSSVKKQVVKKDSKQVVKQDSKEPQPLKKDAEEVVKPEKKDVKNDSKNDIKKDGKEEEKKDKDVYIHRNFHRRRRNQYESELREEREWSRKGLKPIRRRHGDHFFRTKVKDKETGKWVIMESVNGGKLKKVEDVNGDKVGTDVHRNGISGKSIEGGNNTGKSDDGNDGNDGDKSTGVLNFVESNLITPVGKFLHDAVAHAPILGNVFKNKVVEKVEEGGEHSKHDNIDLVSLSFLGRKENNFSFLQFISVFNNNNMITVLVFYNCFLFFFVFFSINIVVVCIIYIFFVTYS